MKLIIAGKRDLHFHHMFIDTIIYNVYFTDNEDITEIVSGGATGVDTAAKLLAKEWEDEVSYKEFPADWDKHGKAAGPIRNKEMAKYGDALLLIWDGESRGSASMKREMQKLNKPIYEIIIRKS